MLNVTPIGTFFTSLKERYEVASQPGLQQSSHGYIELHPGLNFEQALQDLEGFDRIWILFWFHKNTHWKPKVLPPRGDLKRGLFATRSPYRPNPIGLSCVELIKIKGRCLYIASNDLLDQTPILDIKPYIKDFDSFPEAKMGWLDTVPTYDIYTVVWSHDAEAQARFILDHGGPNLILTTESSLRVNPTINERKRISEISNGLLELSYKTWRIHYQIEAKTVFVLAVFSGYSDESLAKEDDPWNDKALHRMYKFRSPK